MVLLLPGLPRHAQAALLRCLLPEAVQGCTVYGLGGVVDRVQLVQQALKALEVCCKALRGRIRGSSRAGTLPENADIRSPIMYCEDTIDCTPDQGPEHPGL